MSHKGRILDDKTLLRVMIKALRSEAQRVGSLHSYWDIIFDAEAWLKELEAAGK